MFQFHIGSIKSRELRRESVANISFNSTLVQLKEDDVTLTGLDLKVFQFHIGSIKSPTLCRQRMPCFYGFNSTLVQLKVTTIFVTKDVNWMFQFHIGSIKRNSR